MFYHINFDIVSVYKKNYECKGGQHKKKQKYEFCPKVEGGGMGVDPKSKLL